MAGYTPLFSEIVMSSIWNEDDKVRIVWITLMALADMDGNVMASISGLAPVARVKVPECEKAIQILSSPDKYSRSQEKEGRRIEAIDGGFHLINHRKYRNKAKTRAAYYREYREEKKKKQKEKKNTNTNTNTNSATTRNVAQQSATVAKTLFLDYVFLTKEEHSKLIEKFGESPTASLIEELNDGIGSKGYKYKSHYHTILSWQRKNEKDAKPASKKTKLFPIKGKHCEYCSLPAVYKGGVDYDFYRCAEHMPDDVKEHYE